MTSLISKVLSLPHFLFMLSVGFIFYSLSIQFKGQPEFILTNWGKQSYIIQNSEF